MVRDTERSVETVEVVKQLIDESFPTFGICLGKSNYGISRRGKYV